MDRLDIAHRRLLSQHLTTPLPDPLAVVRYFGAMQAQEYGLAKWSVGQRTAGADERALQQAIDDATIMRTHALRPTWHFVAAVDLGWIQALTAARVQAGNAPYYRRLGMDDDLFAKAHKVFRTVLRGGNHLTRPELVAAFTVEGIDATDGRMTFIALHAELSALITNGPTRGKQHTYALVDERVRQPVVLDPDEALAELVRRFFTSHGPATLKDFSWWSSLTLTQTRRGIAMLGSELTHETVDGRDYWFVPGPAAPRKPSTVHIFQPYDEYIVAYTESRDLTNLAGLSIREDDNRLINTIAVDSQIIGSWRRVAGRNGITATITLATGLTDRQRRAVTAAFTRYADFLGTPVTVTWA